MVDPTMRRSEFDRIKTPAQAPTLGKFKEWLAHLQALDTIGPTKRWLDGVPPGKKVAHFTGEARLANVDDMRKAGDAKRVTLRSGCCTSSGWRSCARSTVRSPSG